MQTLTFPTSGSTEISFKVGIFGTSTAPQQVSVVFIKDDTTISFVAAKRDDSWVATVSDIGQKLSDGKVFMCVHVLLNNKLFSPMKREVIIGSDISTDMPATPIQTVTAPAPAPAPAPVIVPDFKKALIPMAFEEDSKRNKAPKEFKPTISIPKMTPRKDIVEAMPKKQSIAVTPIEVKPAKEFKPSVNVPKLPPRKEAVEVKETKEVKPIAPGELLKNLDETAKPSNTQISEQPKTVVQHKKQTPPFSLKKTKIIAK